MATQILFGINYVVSKVVIGTFPPLVWASLRIIVSSAVMMGVALCLRRPHPRGGAAFFGPLVIFALLGTIINQASFLVGLRYTTSTNSAILNTLIPVFTLAIVTWRGQEPLTRRRLVGFLVALAGVLAIRRVEDFTLSDSTAVGDLLTIVNCVSYALFLVYSKKFLEAHDAIWTTAWLFVYGSVGLTLLAIPQYAAFSFPAMTPTLWGAVAFAVIGATLLTYFLNFWTLAHAKSSQVALFIYFQPVVAALIAWYWSGEVLTFRTASAMLLIFVGMTLALSQQRTAGRADTVRSVSLRPPIHKRFPVRVTLLYAVPVCAILIAMAMSQYRDGVATETGALQGRLHSIVVSLAQSIPAKIASDTWDAKDAAGLNALFSRVAAAEPEISSLYVLYPTGTPGAYRFAADWTRRPESAARLGQSYDATQAPQMSATLSTARPQIEDEIYTDEWGPSLSGFAPILGAAGTPVALVGCDVTGERVEAIRRHVLRTTAVLFGVALISVAGIGVIVGRSLRAPLERMVDAADRIAGGALEARVGVVRDDEFGILAGRLDRMAAGLQERELIRGIFGRYMSEGLARKILSGPEARALGGEEREVTILFSDIRSYSTISEQLTPTQIVGMLNEYMGAMGSVVDDNGGVVIEFLGDAVLAVFGAPETIDDHAERAVRCARAMDALLLQLNEEWERTGLARLWKARGISRLEARIGVHTGKVVAGNMGGPARVKYAVIGDAVNVASRVEGLNNALGTRVLVTQPTWDRLPAAMQAEGELKGAHPVKGRDQVVVVYTYTPSLLERPLTSHPSTTLPGAPALPRDSD